jgi:hypothetical protein
MGAVHFRDAAIADHQNQAGLQDDIKDDILPPHCGTPQTTTARQVE